MAKPAKKAWNGCSVERALELAKDRNEKLIARGATLCRGCSGSGGSYLGGGICEDCSGAGVILPKGGLRLVPMAVGMRSRRIGCG